MYSHEWVQNYSVFVGKNVKFFFFLFGFCVFSFLVSIYFLILLWELHALMNSVYVYTLNNSL